MKKAIGLVMAATAMFGAASTLADTDIYGNTIQYNDQGEVTYRFWYGDQTAESMSTADSASSAFVMSDAFEPRYRTSAASDGKCPFRGLHIVIR